MKLIQLVTGATWSSRSRDAFNLAEAWRASGRSALMVIPRQWVPQPFIAERGIPFHTINIGGFFDVFAPVQLSKLICGEERCVIHAHTVAEAEVASKAVRLAAKEGAKARIVLTLHRLPDRLTPSVKAVLHSCAAIIVSGVEASGKLNAMDCDVMEKVHPLTPGTPLCHAATPPLPHSLAPEKPITFLYHGAITKAKGTDKVIASFVASSSKPVQLIMAGEGPGRDVMPMIRLIRSEHLTDRVEWPGTVNDLEQLIARCDVGICPGYSPCDFSLGAAECEAMGRTVITDGANLYEAMAYAAEHSDELPGLGSEARSRAILRHSFTHYFERMVEIYRADESHRSC